jgi:hypothetical protein
MARNSIYVKHLQHEDVEQMKYMEPQEGSRGKKFSLSRGKKREVHIQSGGIKTESKRRSQA